MINRIYAYLLFFFIAIHANAQDISITPLNDSMIRVSPGKILTIPLKIANRSNQDLSLKPSLIIPLNWQKMASNTTLLLKANSEDIQIMSLYIPKNEVAGIQYVRYEVEVDFSKEAYSSPPISIKINETAVLDVKVLHVPEYVRAGAQINGEFLIKNLSNKAHNIVLSSKNATIVGDQEIILPPGSSQIIQTKSSTNEELIGTKNQCIDLNTMIENKEATSRKAYQYVKVIPSDKVVRKNKRYIPAFLRLAYLGRKIANNDLVDGFQGELYASSAIGYNDKQYFELHLRGPDHYNLTALGYYEEYYLKYKSPRFSAFIGDKAYALTTLTENARYGRGLELTYSFNDKVEIGSFYQEPRFYPTLKNGLGVYTKFHFENEQWLSCNFLKKEFINSSEAAYLYSLNSAWRPFEATKLDVELSHGYHGNRAGLAAFIHLKSRAIKRFLISATSLIASIGYPGYYTNSKNLNASIHYSLNDKAVLFLNGSQDARNVALDTLVGAAPITKRYKFGSKYNVSKKTSFRIYAQAFELEDRMIEKRFHYSGKSVLLQHDWNERRFNLVSFGELGQTQNYLLPEESRTSILYRVGINTSYQINDNSHLGAFANYANQSLYDELNQEQWLVGIRGNLRMLKHTYIDFSAQNNYAIEDYYRDRSLFEFGLKQHITSQHELSLLTRYAILQQTLADRTYSFHVSYTWYPNLSFEKKRTGGSLKGRISKRSTDKLDGIVLQLYGQSATTDIEGNFQFKDIPPGKYYLTLDKTSIRIDEIASIETPIEIEIIEKEEVFTGFELIRGGKVSGRIMNLIKDVDTKKNSQKFLNSVLVEMYNEQDNIQVLTDKSGHFEMVGVPPGDWNIKVITLGFPNNIYFEQAVQQIRIEEASSKQIDFIVRDKKRKIKFIQKDFSLSN